MRWIWLLLIMLTSSAALLLPIAFCIEKLSSGAYNAPLKAHDFAPSPEAGTPIVEEQSAEAKTMPLPGSSVSRPETILFMGTDVVYTHRGRRIDVTEGLNGNSDTMMVAFMNPASNQLSVLHIPRDTEARIAGYGVRKINSANVIGGPELARETVSNLLNIPIDHYVLLNVHGIVPLVNELGGITVRVPKRMSYMDWTAKLKIDLKPGVHTLTGNQDMGFVRFRHDTFGDIGRVQRQQIFLKAVGDKMMQPASWPHVPALIGIARNNIKTDMSDFDLISALNFAHGVPKSNIKLVLLPGRFSGGGDWVAADGAPNLAAALSDPEQEIASARRDISVSVINASSDPRAANKIVKALRRIGYAASVSRGHLDSTSVTEIIAQSGNSADAKLLKNDLGNVGEIVNASLGDLTTAITVVVRDDLKAENIRAPELAAGSSEDGTY